MKMKKYLFSLVVSFIVMVLTFHFSGCKNFKVSVLQANSHVKKANRYYSEEKYKKAVEEYEAALELNPDLKAIYVYLGTGYRSLYNPMKDDERNKAYRKKAVEYLLKAKKVEPKNDQITAALADIYDKTGDFAAAEKCYLEILENAPHNPKSYYILANFYAKNGKYDFADQMYQKRISLNPGEPDGYHYYVGFLQDQRRWADAIAAHEKRLYAMLDASIIPILQEIAGLETKDKKVEELRSQLKDKIRQAEAAVDSWEPEMKQQIAEVYYGIGHVCWNWSYQTQPIYMSAQERESIIDKGLENLKKAIQIAPEYAAPYSYIGLLYREKAKVEPLKRDEFFELNREYNKKFLAVYKRKQKGEAYRKLLDKMGKE